MRCKASISHLIQKIFQTSKTYLITASQISVFFFWPL